MPRHPRLDTPGSFHHVMNRGARQEPIFPDNEACATFVGLMAELPSRFGLEVHGYSLMPNHFHLLVRVGLTPLGTGMRYLQSGYSRWLNRQRAWDGPLWRARYKSRWVESEPYLRHVLAYMHLNPVAARLAPTADSAEWTSHKAYVGAVPRPEWLTTDALVELFGTVAAYDEYVEDVVRGRDVVPDGFDADQLWRSGRRTLPPAVESEPAPPKRGDAWPMSDASAWEALRLVTGLEDEQLRERGRGRGGKTPWALVQWWLPRATARPAAQVAAELGVSPSTLSRAADRIRKLCKKDDAVAAWVERLESLLPSAAG